MKKRILLFTSSIVLFAALTMSYEQGPAHYANSNYTGGPGSFGSTCGMGGCHTSTSGTTTIAIDVRKASDNSPVTAYLGDTTYIVKISGDNTNANLTHFGFQFMALEAANTNNNAGTFGAFPGGVDDDLAVGPQNIVEHTQALPQTGGQYEVEFEWTAPNTGTGTVNMYAIINAVNNNNNADNSDRPSAPFTYALPEATTAVSSLNADINISAYPNPVIDRLNLEIANANGVYGLKVIDMNGKVVAEQSVDAKATIDTRNWAPGLYQVQLINDDATHTISVLK